MKFKSFLPFFGKKQRGLTKMRPHSAPRRRRRPLELEALERREMLAGDAS